MRLGFQPMEVGARALGDHAQAAGGGAIERALAAAEPVRGMRILHVSAAGGGGEVPELLGALDGVPEARALQSRARLDDLGRALGQELIAGGQTPLWDAVSKVLVEEAVGGSGRAADGVVVMRSAPPQRGDTARFLTGFYGGLATGGPAVGVEATTAERSTIRSFVRARFSSVDNIDTPIGRVSLAVLLSGEDEGHFGVKRETAEDGYVPRVDTVPPPPPARD